MERSIDHKLISTEGLNDRLDGVSKSFPESLLINSVTDNSTNADVDITKSSTELKFISCSYLDMIIREKEGEQLWTTGSKLGARFENPDMLLSNTLQGLEWEKGRKENNGVIIPNIWVWHNNKGYTVRCFDRKDQQYRCVKAASKHLVQSKKSWKQASIPENFIREQRVLKQLSEQKDFPNTICKYITHWEANQFYYMATEYCCGGNLFQYMVQ
ncbi:hypothetical protein RFI_32394, partial [Reticulomyxa filosa]